MRDAIDFLDRIEGHGYGGTADYEVARTTVRDGAAEIKRLRAALRSIRERADMNSHYSYVELCDTALVGNEQQTPAAFAEAKADRDAGWPD